MKAIIVIDIPIEIPDDHIFKVANDLFGRLRGCKCELKPMPQEMEYESDWDDVDISFRQGWNACLEEIEK